MQGKWEKEREKEEEKVKELMKAREILINDVVQLKESLHTDKSKFETKIKALLDEISSKDGKMNSLMSNLEKVKAELNTTIQSLEKSELTYAQYLKYMEEFKSEQESKIFRLEEDIRKQQLMLSAAAVERDAAMSKVLELEAAVGAAVEERRGLLERCLVAEGETDRTRNVTIELRRKMEDSQADIHELGRENQSLQVGYKINSFLDNFKIIEM